MVLCYFHLYAFVSDCLPVFANSEMRPKMRKRGALILPFELYHFNAIQVENFRITHYIY